MIYAIVAVVSLGYIFMACEQLTRINKALVALFCGTVGWILFLSTGTAFIDVLHAQEFRDFLGSEPYSLHLSKVFIADHIFLKYVAQVGSLALYLLATMSIMEVLINNNCFWFVEKWIRHRNSMLVVWTTAIITFLLSTCIDNLTITVMMLMVIKKILSDRRQRRILGCIILISAAAGGCWTVIGDVTSLLVWTSDNVTATNFSGALALPALVSMVIPVAFIGRKLPDHLDIERPDFIYRGDDSIMPVWQKLILLFFGIGGLWFIPSFYRITLLPPFLGALCCLGVVWMLNEIFNMSRIRTAQPIIVTEGRSLQYEVMQMIIYCVGICLCMDVMIECGAMRAAQEWVSSNMHHSIYLISITMGLISSVLDNVALVMAGINIFDLQPQEMINTSYLQYFVPNGQYWHLITLCGQIGGCLLPIGSVAGLALMKSEKVGMWWYIKNITLYVLIGWLFALGTYFLSNMLFSSMLPDF